MLTRTDRAASAAETPAIPVPGRERWTWLYALAPALHSRNFRLFWLGQLISVVGTSVQVVAEGWLIYSLTESTLWLGMVGFLALIPVVPISLAGGVLIDRMPRRKLLLVTQTLLLLQAMTFGVLAVTGGIQLWHIVTLYFVFGAILAIDHPARRAFLVELVDQEDLASAVALNATVFNMSSLIGYALAGVMIAALGVGVTLLFNAATYLAPIAVLLLIRLIDVSAEQPVAGQRAAFRVAVWEGLAVLWRRPDMLGVIGLMAVVGGLAYPVFGMMPAYAQDVIGTGSVGLGMLLSAGALGSVLGTVVVGRVGAHRRGQTLTAVSLALPLLVLGFALAGALWQACILLVLIGLALLILQSLTITLVQVHIDNRVRGRVMSLYSQLHAGSDTMGNMLIGGAASLIGLPAALALGAAAALAFAAGLRTLFPVVSRFE